MFREEFSQLGDCEGEFRDARGITVGHNGEIIVTDYLHEKAFIFHQDGSHKSTLTSPATAELKYPERVAVTSQGKLVLTDQSNAVKVFDINGGFLHDFSTNTPTDENANASEYFTCGVAVTYQNYVIVGDRARGVLTIHSEANEWVPKEVKVPIKPVYLAITNQNQILVSDCWEKKVVKVTMDGQVIFTMDTFKVDGEAAFPDGVTCDGSDDMYIAVIKEGKDNSGERYTGTGHIHHYDKDGVFLRCVARDLYWPQGLHLHNGSLYIANEKSVVIYDSK